MPADAFAPASTSGRPLGGGAQADSPLSAPTPMTHVEIRGRNGPERRAPKPHTNPIHMCTGATIAVCCCYCCCCAAAEVNLLRAVAATTAAVLLLRFVELLACHFFATKQRRTKNCKSLSQYQNLKKQF